MRLAALLIVLPSLALADDQIVGEEIIRVDGGYVDGVNTTSTSFGSETVSYRSVPKGWLIMEGQELGAELRFLTAPSFGGAELAFTDVTFLTLRGRTALTRRADLFATVDVLPKQPSTTDELIWQSGSLGINVQPWAKPLALFARGNGGVLLDRSGYWGQAGIGAIARTALHEIMRFEGSASVVGTQLRPEAAEHAWFVEAAVAGSVLFHDPEGWTGGWLGFNYSLPVAHDGGMLDPQPRIDVELGVVLSFVEHWDVFARFAVIDRGDAGQMTTQLPILDGGFDQRQVIFGVTYHTR